ncbi:hypothetical protein BH20ACT8_BH20ACT8_15220 [soil metagenome]
MSHQRPLRRLADGYRRVVSFHDALFVAPWRAGLERESRRQEELLVTLVFLEALGVENPAGYYTLELYPELAERFHAWHQDAGMRRAPEPGVCC